MLTDLAPPWISLKTALVAPIATFFLGITTAYWMLNYHSKGKVLLEELLISSLFSRQRSLDSS